jgi:hypothetical protein
MQFLPQPSLPPRRQSCRRMLTGEAKQGVWEAGPILLPLVPGNESACIRWGTRKTKGISIALQRSRPPSTPQKPKIRKSVAKPRHVSRRGLKRRRFVLKELVGPLTHEAPPALGMAAKPAWVPSLDAKYGTARKSCQEKISKEPQNIRCGVSNSSIGSGGCAERPQRSFPRGTVATVLFKATGLN